MLKAKKEQPKHVEKLLNERKLKKITFMLDAEIAKKFKIKTAQEEIPMIEVLTQAVIRYVHDKGVK